MKCVLYPEAETGGKLLWSWRLETEAGTVIAKSTRSFEELAKCERELKDVISNAAKSKIIRKKIESTPENVMRRIFANISRTQKS